MAANMYRVGDFVYFETSSTAPYQIRRIEELNKTSSGNVEAKVMCFYRRRDISASLVSLADKHHDLQESDSDSEEYSARTPSVQKLTSEEKRLLRHRELFLSRQVETLPATHIRGKCSVSVLSDSDQLALFLNNEDTYFYSLTYDSSQKTLLADKGEIRVGPRYQADSLPEPLERPEDDDGRRLEDLETLVWKPDNGLDDAEIDKFLVLTRSLGTFARALDPSSSVRQPSLHMSAAAASRDVTLLYAMEVLHESEYCASRALSSLVASKGPLLRRDQMEEWCASEANLFEEALDKYGKDFNDIRQDFLAWKTLKNIVEYYYMWKTTDRYVQQKRIKAAESDSKLKQVYIPTYNKANPVTLTGRAAQNGPGTRPCEGCAVQQSDLWLSWGALHTGSRVCRSCWDYWKKMGALKNSKTDEVSGFAQSERPHPGQRQERIAMQQQTIRLHRCHVPQCGKEFRTKAHLARHLAQMHDMLLRPPTPEVAAPAAKSRTTFWLLSTPLTRVCRRLCQDLLLPRRAARCPARPLDVQQLKHSCLKRLEGKQKPLFTKRKARSSELTLAKLGVDIKLKPSLLERSAQVEPQHLAFPRPKEPVPLPSELRSSAAPPPIMKRPLEANGFGEPATKRSFTQNINLPMQSNGVHGPVRNVPGAECAEDVLFRSNNFHRVVRKKLGFALLRKAARRPGLLLLIKERLSATPANGAEKTSNGVQQKFAQLSN